MKKLFGKKKKGDGDSSKPEPAKVAVARPQPLQASQNVQRTHKAEVLPVRPEYLNLEGFKIPSRAYPMLGECPSDGVPLEQCRRCSGQFRHTFMDWTTIIIAGIPKTNEYRAISYVWGNALPLPMKCLNCGYTFTIPMESAYKFRRLMMMTANSGESIWLDALSIDQTNLEEKSKILAVMGDIYSRAHTVGVLFPVEDGEGFKTVYDLTKAATAINLNKLEFYHEGQDGHENPRLVELSRVCQQFYQMLGQFNQDLQKYKYWSRAWTFQEWALARNISITWQGGMPQNMEPVKTTILHAATLTAIYAFSVGEYTTIKMGFPRAEMPERFEQVKRLFPDEEAFYPPGVIDDMSYHASMMMPSLLFGDVLGLRASRPPDFRRQGGEREYVFQLYSLRPGLPEKEDERFRHRFIMALNAFSTSEREAKYKADLINCWASMCNIKYEYDESDNYVVALQKALNIIRRERKITIFNFLVSTAGASGEVDACFQEYAHPHEQCNAAIVKGKFSDIPIFSGRADTGTHLRLALARHVPFPKLEGTGVPLRKVRDASIFHTTPFSDQKEVLYHMARLVSGTADQMVFSDVVSIIAEILQKTPATQLNQWTLVVVRIPLDSPQASKMAKAMGMLTWAIVPSRLDLNTCIIVREGLNGTLGIASRTGSKYEIVAYLTLTDHQSGTLLIPVKIGGTDQRRGDIEVTLKSPIRAGVMNSELFGERLIKGSLQIEPETYVAF